jgi:hypothetical protein
MAQNAKEGSGNGESGATKYTEWSLANAGVSGGLVISGLNLLFSPDTSFSVIAIRAVIVGASGAVGHILSTEKMRDVTLGGITKESAAIAFSTGALMSTGFAYLFYGNDKRSKFLKRCIGGTLINFGMFLWVPSAVRYAWQFDMTYLTPDIATSAIVKNSVKGLLLGWIWDVVSYYVGKAFHAGVKVVNEYRGKETNTLSDKGEQEQQLIPTSLQKPLGGAFFMVGLYLWVPPALRGYFDISGRIKTIFRGVTTVLPFLLPFLSSSSSSSSSAADSSSTA